MSTPSAPGVDKHPPPRNKYSSEFFSPSHIKLTNNSSNKDFKSRNLNLIVKYSRVEEKRELVRGIRTRDLTHISLKPYPLRNKRMNTWSICYFFIKN